MTESKTLGLVLLQTAKNNCFGREIITNDRRISKAHFTPSTTYHYDAVREKTQKHPIFLVLNDIFPTFLTPRTGYNMTTPGTFAHWIKPGMLLSNLNFTPSHEIVDIYQVSLRNIRADVSTTTTLERKY